jgi:hypothetical protein
MRVLISGVFGRGKLVRRTERSTADALGLTESREERSQSAMEYVLLWLLCGFIAAIIGGRKGEGCLGFVLGVLLGPFGILIAIASKGNRKQCTFCKEWIHKDAIICPHCQKELRSGSSQGNSANQAAANPADKPLGKPANRTAVVVAVGLITIVLVGITYVAFFSNDTSPPSSTGPSVAPGPAAEVVEPQHPRAEPNLPKCPEMSDADRAELLARMKAAKDAGGSGAAMLVLLAGTRAPDPLTVEYLSSAICKENGGIGLPYQLSGLRGLHIIGAVGSISNDEVRIVGRTDPSKYVTIPLRPGGNELVAEQLAKIGIPGQLSPGSPIEVWCSADTPNYDNDPIVKLYPCVKSLIGSADLGGTGSSETANPQIQGGQPNSTADATPNQLSVPSPAPRAVEPTSSVVPTTSPESVGGSQPSVVPKTDAAIVDEINAKLWEDETLKRLDIRVASQNGVVTLSGTVSTGRQKATVEAIAKKESGVHQVVNELIDSTGLY